jgi:hypothetical protein
MVESDHAGVLQPDPFRFLQFLSPLSRCSLEYLCVVLYGITINEVHVWLRRGYDVCQLRNFIRKEGIGKCKTWSKFNKTRADVTKTFIVSHRNYYPLLFSVEVQQELCRQLIANCDACFKLMFL